MRALLGVLLLITKANKKQGGNKMWFYQTSPLRPPSFPSSFLLFFFTYLAGVGPRPRPWPWCSPTRPAGRKREKRRVEKVRNGRVGGGEGGGRQRGQRVRVQKEGQGEGKEAPEEKGRLLCINTIHP